VSLNIRAWRLERGLSQAELGARLGVTQQQIQRYEGGASRLAASRLNQIATALGVPLQTLFHDKPVLVPDALARALLADPRAFRLAQAFHKITSNRTRIAVLHLIESVGEKQTRLN
jgi:transcriptional regulator with XRE-family HTH domain